MQGMMTCVMGQSQKQCQGGVTWSQYKACALTIFNLQKRSTHSPGSRTLGTVQPLSSAATSKHLLIMVYTGAVAGGVVSMQQQQCYD